MPRLSSAVRTNSTDSSDEGYSQSKHTSRSHSSSTRQHSSTSSRTLPPISSIGAGTSHRASRSAVHAILNPVEPPYVTSNEAREPRTRSHRDESQTSSLRAKEEAVHSSRHRDSISYASARSEHAMTPGASQYNDGCRVPSLPGSGSSGSTSYLNEPASPYAHPGSTYSHVGGTGMQIAHSAMPVTGQGSQQGAYRLMMFDPEQGSIEIPVDVVGASRVADEKRRRNAGASARFRARKKEKEQASTKELDDMRQQIQDLGEDAEFYRQERDVLASALYSTTEGERHFPRRPSPRQFRSASGRESSDMEMEYTRGPSVVSDPHSGFDEGEQEDLRYLRRRLTSSVPSEAMSIVASPQAYSQATYAQPVYQQAVLPPPATHHHHHHHHHSSQASGPAQAPVSTSSRSGEGRHHSSRTTERPSKDPHRRR